MIEKKQLTVFSIMVFILIFCYQAAYAAQFQGSLTFNMGFPQGEFNENLEKNGFGLGFNFGVKMGKSPFVLGAEMGILNYGQDTRYESFYNIPDLVVKVVNSYNILQGHVFLRFQPTARGSFHPYIDALLGLNYLWAQTSIEDNDDEGDISSVNYDDTASSYGIGGGLMVRLGGAKERHSQKKIMEFLLDFRVRYLWGGNAEYLQEGSIVVDGQEVTYYVSESKTDLLTFQIGFALNF
ncbi:MAG: outer membrane beta-barrel protein [Candidatus Aminicenantes bacterium]|nr:MAG: outer membrane beta-barrel protein [Candidatus Aminicenantes bacterium]